jgi:hypothetical protein
MPQCWIEHIVGYGSVEVIVDVYTRTLWAGLLYRSGLFDGLLFGRHGLLLQLRDGFDINFVSVGQDASAIQVNIVLLADEAEFEKGV